MFRKSTWRINSWSVQTGISLLMTHATLTNLIVLITITYRGSHISLSWFSCTSSILVKLEFGENWQEYLDKNPRSKARTNNNLNSSHCGTGPESNPGHIGG